MRFGVVFAVPSQPCEHRDLTDQHVRMGTTWAARVLLHYRMCTSHLKNSRMSRLTLGAPSRGEWCHWVANLRLGITRSWEAQTGRVPTASKGFQVEHPPVNIVCVGTHASKALAHLSGVIAWVALDKV
jgi:hypothetical protein